MSLKQTKRKENTKKDRNKRTKLGFVKCEHRLTNLQHSDKDLLRGGGRGVKQSPYYKKGYLKIQNKFKAIT